VTRATPRTPPTPQQAQQRQRDLGRGASQRVRDAQGWHGEPKPPPRGVTSGTTKRVSDRNSSRRRRCLHAMALATRPRVRPRRWCLRRAQLAPRPSDRGPNQSRWPLFAVPPRVGSCSGLRTKEAGQLSHRENRGVRRMQLSGILDNWLRRHARFQLSWAEPVTSATSWSLRVPPRPQSAGCQDSIQSRQPTDGTARRSAANAP
jgi:hypothetical protein